MRVNKATLYEGAPCPYCGAKTRRQFALPKSQKGHVQHTRRWACENGHQIIRKRG